MIVSSYGAGTNSTAMLIECVNRGIKVDLITFADTGGERPHTYQYVKTFSEWLVARGYPAITVVQTVDKGGKNITLEEYCLDKGQLPSLAYGFKSCSDKHKIRPQNKFMNNYDPAKAVWKSGEKIIKMIGYDIGEGHRADNAPKDDPKYDFWYPLIEWDMGREECVETIEKAGLCQPGKSSCFFCPSMRATEIRQLNAVYPELMDRALAMEANAELTHVKGLGRNFAWKDLIATDDMFGEDFAHSPELLCGCYDG